MTDVQRSSKSHRRRSSMGQDAATPYSLYFDGVTGVVNCGTHASIMDLHNGDFTADCYYQYLSPGADGTLLSQGLTGSNEGWQLVLRFGLSRFQGQAFDNWLALCSCIGMGDGDWSYMRIRKSGGTVYCSRNAGAEASDAAGGPVDTSLSQFQIGDAATAFKLLGRICYVHLWNNSQGTLGAVPTSPFAVDANTVARYTFSEGAGAALGDDIGNSNGTIVGATWSPTVPVGWSLA